MSFSKIINYNNPASFTSSSGVLITTDVRLNPDGLSPNGLVVTTLRVNKDPEKYTSVSTNTLNGGAVLTTVGGIQYLDCTGGINGRRLTIDGSNASFSQEGTIRFKYVPDYSISPSANRFFFDTADGATNINKMFMHHQSSQNIEFRVYNDAGVLVLIKSFGNWAVVLGQEYEIELCINFTAGLTQLFIDGVQQGTDLTTTLTRGSVTYFDIGGGVGKSSNAYFRDIQIFDDVKHTSGFAGEIPRYLIVDDQTIIESGSQLLEGISNLAESGASRPTGSDLKYILNIDSIDKYWDSAAWSTSDGSLAQSNTISEINTNASALSLTNGADIKVKIILSSTSLEVSPIIEQNSYDYNFFSYQVGPSCCVVWNYIMDGCNNPVSGASLHFYTKKPYFYEGNRYTVNEKVTTRANGYFEVSLPIQELDEENLIVVEIEYIDGEGEAQSGKYNIRVPIQNSAELEDIIVEV